MAITFSVKSGATFSSENWNATFANEKYHEEKCFATATTTELFQMMMLYIKCGPFFQNFQESTKPTYSTTFFYRIHQGFPGP